MRRENSELKRELSELRSVMLKQVKQVTFYFSFVILQKVTYFTVKVMELYITV